MDDDITAKVRELIFERHKNLKAFAEAAELPYTTVDTIMKRGILNTSSNNVFKICKCLKISADKLSEGELVSNKQIYLSPDEVEMIEEYRILDSRARRVIRRLIKAEYDEEMAVHPYDTPPAE